MYKVFIDGREGTTGLRIFDRIKERDDISLIVLEEKDRKDPEARKKAINESDITILCLPDAASVESVSLCENDKTVIIDASTAHRTNDGWAYGFPEINGWAGYEKIASAKRIAVPGCHASGFIALVKPLIDSGLLSADTSLVCNSLTGYSGGGKKMIAQYESNDKDALLCAPRVYGITQNHKHLKEMKHICGLSDAPMFTPIVSDFYSGMCVTVCISAKDINGSVEDIKRVYSELYNTNIVKYVENIDKEGFISAASLSGYDNMAVSVLGNEERILLCALYDNLGKGASGAAIECLNLVTGKDKDYCLNISN
ncbi:MAG: N-acetyl-gamma-glutamyl-phosphate reductase [Clostridia bacterium]|nr:N-acetyl-gamma-glutamyl-phosphate reductase [Clostridia bacterium]